MKRWPFSSLAVAALLALSPALGHADGLTGGGAPAAAPVSITAGATGCLTLSPSPLTGTGTVDFGAASGNCVLGSAQQLNWNSDLILSRKAAASLQLGADSAAPTLQTIGINNVVAGTSNTNGVTLQMNAGQGTGTGTGGAFDVFVAQAGTTGTAQNALVRALRVGSDGALTLSGFTLTGGSSPEINASQTWNNAGQTYTGAKFNFTCTACNAASLLLDAQLATVSKFSVNQAGNIVNAGTIASAGTITVNGGSAVSTNNFTSASAGGFLVGTRSQMFSNADGEMDFTNAAGTAPAGFVTKNFMATKTTNYTVVVLDSGKVFNNQGAAGEVDFTLPTGAAGYRYSFCTVTAQVLKIIATNSATINNGATVTAANGNATNSVAGSCIEIQAIDATHWYTTGTPIGTWTLT